MTHGETRTVEMKPCEASGQADVPGNTDTSYLQPIMHRRNRETGIFERLYPEDRQMYFAFVAKVA